VLNLAAPEMTESLDRMAWFAADVMARAKN